MQQNDFQNGKCANKENETNNGRLTKSSSGIDSDFDWTKKQAISEQRKSRLVEVRLQSKGIASQILENVRKEEQKQIERIKRIKQDELFKWREKQKSIVESNYKKSLEQFGQAHLAAERENAKEKQFELQKEKNRRLALKRGKTAAQKLKEDKDKMKPNQPVNNVKEKKVVTISTKITSSPESSDSSTSSTSSSDSPNCSVLVEDKRKPTVKTKTNAKTVIPPKKKSLEQAKSSIRTVYNPQRFASANNSSDVSLTDSPMSDGPPPFITTVSDLLGRKPVRPALRSSPYIAKTYRLDKSPVATRTTTKKTPQKEQINAVSSRLSRVIKTPSKTSGKSPMKVLPERKHFVPEFVKGKRSTVTRNDSSLIETTPHRSSRVQFYDHANKFSRKYDGNFDLEEYVQKVTPLNAWDEARRDISRNELESNQLLNMEKLAENRSKVALEKEKIRKDYELMSAQLSDILKNNELAHNFVQTNELLSESRLKQIAEEKQQLMNKEFRGLSKTPVPITCPKVNAKKNAKPPTQHRPQSGEINVAKYKSDAQKSKEPQIDDTSDSAHSFLLDYVTERTNNICDDIDRCRKENNNKGTNQTKIKALHELLNKVNAFRRLLCEEIKQNNGDISRIDTSQFINEIDKVEEKQHSIMKQKAAAKISDQKQSKEDREHELMERERRLKIKESCIDEMAHELYLRERKIQDQKKQSNTETVKPTKDKKVTVVTNNGSESMDEIPVRIVINVNKNEQRKEKPEVVVTDVKWREKLKKSSKENIEVVSVTNGAGKMYPKTPAKQNCVKVERKQPDDSSQSTITSYLSPPNQIKTQLSKEMQKSAINKKVIQSPEQNLRGNDTELLHYIIRMLGMSRASVEQLNMSSVSTVKTPNSSIVNISSNLHFTSSSTSTPISQVSCVSAESFQAFDQEKLQQIARFLAESNNFGGNTRKNSKDSAASSGAWGEILSKKNEPSSKSEKADSEKPKQLKTVSLESNVTQDPDDKLSRDDLIAKYDELAASCTKRIINLDSMISKVREEKQKLLENTISSASSLMTGQKDHPTGVTEYMDYPQQEQNQQAQQVNNNTGSSLSDSKGTNAPSSDFSSTSGTAEISLPNENRTGLFATKNKLLGESKDSGVGISRPVTSSDYRESPDLKQNSKADADNSSKLLQNALRESKKGNDLTLKDIPNINYTTSSGNVVQEEQSSPEQTATNARDKYAKPAPPPVAMARYSPHMEDELPHELSTITEVDTPGTSRLNATDATNANDTTLKSTSVKLALDNLIYSTFPEFKEYLKSKDNVSGVSMACINDTADITTEPSAILNEKLGKILEPAGSQADEFKYKPFEGERPHIDSKHLNESEIRLSYIKFPTHSEYANAVSGLIDSQSLEDLHMSDSNGNSNSSLPDIVNELKSRKILDHSFEEAEEGKGDNLEGLLIANKNPHHKKTAYLGKAVSSLTTEQLPNHDGSLSDVLENDLNNMGFAWATAEMKKTKAVGNSTSVSSDSSVQTAEKPLSPVKQRLAKRSYQKMNQSKATNDSFVDKNILALPNTVTIEGSVTTQQTGSELHGKSINLKDFLARELMKHSSMSSSSDSSLASLFLQSFLGRSISPGTPQNRGIIDKHRTSTPVDHSSDGVDSSKRNYRTSSINKDSNKNQTDSPTFFSNDSQISSVRMNSTDTSSSVLNEERKK